MYDIIVIVISSSEYLRVAHFLHNTDDKDSATEYEFLAHVTIELPMITCSRIVLNKEHCIQKHN
jgi:hypothetical protein